MTATAHRANIQPAPRLRPDDGGGASVVRWGQLGELVLRPGDRLVPGTGSSGVLLLMPRGRGRPMLGVREGRRLLALPARVPASEARWQVAGRVEAVERELERGGPRHGRWHVAVRFEGESVHPRLLDAERDLADGELDARALDALCLRASLAHRRFGVAVAVAVARSPGAARDAVQDTPTGTLRIVLATEPDGQAGTVIVGPWSGSTGPARSTQVLLPFAADTPRED